MYVLRYVCMENNGCGNTDKCEYELVVFEVFKGILNNHLLSFLKECGFQFDSIISKITTIKSTTTKTTLEQYKILLPFEFKK